MLGVLGSESEVASASVGALSPAPTQKNMSLIILPQQKQHINQKHWFCNIEWPTAKKCARLWLEQNHLQLLGELLPSKVPRISWEWQDQTGTQSLPVLLSECCPIHKIHACIWFSGVPSGQSTGRYVGRPNITGEFGWIPEHQLLPTRPLAIKKIQHFP